MKNKSLTLVLHLYKNISNLQSCLDSLFNQTNKEFNLFIIDDEITDEIKQLLIKYDWSKLKNIKYISFNQNLGHSFAFNTIIDKIETDFLFYFGSNLTFDKNFVFDVLEKINNFDVDIISFCETKEKETKFIIKNISDFILNDFLEANRYKVFSKKFLVENNIKYNNFKHHTFNLFLSLLKTDCRWLIVSRHLIKISKNDFLSYNILDIIEQCDDIIHNLNTSGTFEFLNKDEIEFLLIYMIFNRFILRSFLFYPNGHSLHDLVLKMAKKELNKLPNWRNNKYLSNYNDQEHIFVNFSLNKINIKRNLRRFKK